MAGNNSESELELNFYKKTIKNGDIIFDVGARDSNIPLVNNNAFYYLFEPIGFNYYNLIERFKNQKNIIIENTCLSNKNETTQIYVESESIHRRIDYRYVWDTVQPHRVKNGDTETIYCITLKEYIEKNNIQKIDVLKIDVEGYECNVIEGLFEHIDKVECVVFEYAIGTYSSSGFNLLQILNMLKNFKFYLLEGSLQGETLLNGTNEEIYENLKNNSNCNIIAKRNG